MKNKKTLYVLIISLFILCLTNFSLAQSFYLENLKFKSLYSLSKLIVNPVQKISYLNSLLEQTFTIYKKAPNNKFIFDNYLLVLKDLEKEWSKFSFKYSSYPLLYERSLDLYFKQLTGASNKQIEKYILSVIIKVTQNIDTKEGIEKLNQISSKYNLNFNNLKISQEVDLSKKINYLELVNILKELQTIVKEFENGERIITGDYNEFEKRILEIQKEARLAQQSIKDLNIEEYNENIKKLKENLNFIKKNSKKIK